MSSEKPPLQPIQLIRLALLAGVLMFGAVTLLVHRRPGWEPGVMPTAMGYALVALGVAAVLIARVMRARVVAESDPEKRRSLLIMTWSVGEAAALLGSVMFFVTGQGQWYLFGVTAMLATFVLVPIPRAT